MTELEAARLVLAGLEILRDAVPDNGGTVTEVLGMIEEVDARVRALTALAPPWEPEPGPSVELPWSQVACGDEVQAPNGTWYHVDSVARMGPGSMVVLLKLPTGSTVKSTPKAGDKVPVRRGPAGQAMDIFRVGGLELETITSGAAA